MKIKISSKKLQFIIPHFLKLGCGVYLCGGAIRSWLNGEAVADYDLFVHSGKPIEDGKPSDEMLAEEIRLKTFGFKRSFLCKEGKLITVKNRGIKVQIIRTELKSASDIISRFDFTCCMFGSDGEFIYASLDAFRDAKRKLIRINKLEYPAASIGRLFKYKERGYICDQHTKKQFIEMSQKDSGGVIDASIVYID